MKKNLLTIASLLLLTGALQAQVQMNNGVTNGVSGSNVLIDGSTFFSPEAGATNNLGKGIVVPGVDLTLFEFDLTLADGVTFPSYFDGMIVYNRATGKTLTTGNRPSTSVDVVPGFYYFSNPSGAANGSITAGLWKPIGDSNASIAYSAANGMTLSGFTMGLGGPLTAATNVDQATFPLTFDGTASAGMGTSAPDPSARLDVSSTTKGFLPPRMTTAQRDAIVSPATGLVVYNTTEDCLNYKTSNAWVGMCGLPAAVISALICGLSAPTAVLTAGLAASGVSTTVDYTGGNAGGYPSQSIPSTGVTGLTATLPAGILASGNGNVTYTVSGTPSAAGNAFFALTLGGQNCMLAIPVRPQAAVASFTCGSASTLGTLTSAVAAANVSSSIPYSGGNSGGYAAQSVTSTGVTGLTATRTAGLLANGSGSVTYTISGTPSAVGTADFAITLGGQSCTLSIPVNPPPAAVTAFTCGSATNSGSLYSGTAAAGVTSSIPYTGGNGGTFTAQSVSSVGVSGLVATLSAGTLANGSGSVTYTITGTPSSPGTAGFILSLGGQNCVLNLPVYTLPSVTALSCGSAATNGMVNAGIGVSGVSSSVPYSGGNGVSYTSESVASTGVTGLTATRPAGTLASGNGNITYTITGTPSAKGTASFAINLGGQSCTFNITVQGKCGAYTAPGVWQEFMCHNLGADTNADPFTPSAAIHGAKYQWGTMTGEAGRYISQADDQANWGPVPGFNGSAKPITSWQDNVKTAEDPCPAGYRVPTKAQWQGVVANNTLTRLGSWAWDYTNYTTAAKLGSNLLLPTAGFRNDNSSLYGRGARASYWSSTNWLGANGSGQLEFSNTYLVVSNGVSNGELSPVRCIAE